MTASELSVFSLIQSRREMAVATFSEASAKIDAIERSFVETPTCSWIEQISSILIKKLLSLKFYVGFKILEVNKNFKVVTNL